MSDFSTGVAEDSDGLEDLEEEPGSASDSSDSPGRDAPSPDAASGGSQDGGGLRDLSDAAWCLLVARLQCGVDTLSVDLISQLGSFGPLLVDGSALLREVASNAYLDWQHGGQLLHAIFLAERFLAHLLEKGPKVAVFFFEDEGGLHREALQVSLCAQLQDHLRRLESTATGLQLHVLPGSWLTDEGSRGFRGLLRAVGPSCVLTDFARPMPSLPPHLAAPTSDFAEAKACGFVHWLHLLELHVVALEGLRTSGPHIDAVLLTPGRLPPGARACLFKWLRGQLSVNPPESGAAPSPELLEVCGRFVEESKLFRSQRLVVGALALWQLVREREVDSTEDGQLHLPLAAAFCLAVSLQQVLPLRQRYIADEQLKLIPDAVRAEVPGFLALLHKAVVRAILCYRQVRPLGLDGTLADVIDGRLLHAVIGRLSSASSTGAAFEMLPASAAPVAEGLWSECCAEPLREVSARLAQGAREEGAAERDRSSRGGALVQAQFEPPARAHAEAQGSPANPVRIREVFSKSDVATGLLDSLERSRAAGQRSSGAPRELPLTRFEPHHFHSCRPLDDTLPDAFHPEVTARPIRTLRIDNQEHARLMLSVLSETGVVSVGRGQRLPLKIKIAIRQRGVTFRLTGITDRTAAALPVCDRSALQQRLQGSPSFPIIMQFSMEVSKEAQEMRAQKHARSETKFIASLLQGAPVEPKVIGERHSPAVIAALKQEALARLRPSTSTSASAQSVGAREGQGVAHGKKATRGQKGKAGVSGSGSVPGPSRTVDRVRQQVRAEQQEKLMKQALQQVDESKQMLKSCTGAEQAAALEALQGKAKKWWEGGATAAGIKAQQVCVKTAADMDEKQPAESSNRRWTFLAVQAALRMAGGPGTLRTDGGEEGQQLLGKMERLAAKHLKMPALAAALKLEGAQDQRKHRSKHSETSAPTGEACPFRFQLEVVPEHLARPSGKADPRVQGFRPDDWQSKLLDVVDADQSALVLAPTASGKTFISFYVMEKVLRTDDEGVVVYVCPTKALANQVHAEIQARYDKEFKAGHNRVIAGIFTRDFRQHEKECQVLVTVPQCLVILLLCPAASSRQWTARLRHAIVDEVHCLGQGDGSVWEQALLLLDCPILALSATLGEAEGFAAWLRSVEASRGRELHVVQHTGRFNDLQPWLFSGSLDRLHPYIATTSCRPGHGTQHVHMIPEDCLKLYEALSEASDASATPGPQGPATDMPEKPDASAWSAKLAALAPEKFFADVPDACWNLSMGDAKAWQSEVSRLFDDAPPALRERALGHAVGHVQEAFGRVRQRMDECGGQVGYLRKEIRSLAKALHERGMFPAICFHNSREGCLALAAELFMALQEEENARIEELERWLSRSRLAKTLDRGEEDGQVTEQEGSYLEELERLKVARRMLLAIKREFTVWIKGVPTITRTELEEEFAAVRFEGFNPAIWHNRILLRGIGVHHAGLPKHYRQIVERLFRARRLGLVVSTSTLALGINMPCKTSIFAGDSVYLDAMQYQQEAGRAGRRGFDLRGHTVFFGLPMQKVQLLLGAELPLVRGNRPLSPSLVLRMMLNIGAASSQPAIARLLDHPLFCPTPSMPLSNSNLFSFYVQDMVRNQLLTPTLEGTELAGFVAHIFFETPGNFALVELLRDPDLLREVCVDRAQLVLLLCHLFCRRPLSQWMLCHGGRSCRPRLLEGPSLVALPAMPGRAHEALVAHVSELLGRVVHNLSGFVEACKAQLGDGCELPLSKVCPCPGADGEEDSTMVSRVTAPRDQWPKLRSPFVALSGRGDNFGSLAELCETSLDCLRLEPDLFPALDVGEGVGAVLNSYLFDFYRHGQVRALTRYNKVPGSELWTHLEDFRLVLKALAAAAQHQPRASALSDPQVVSTLAAVSDEFDATMRKGDMSGTPM